VPGELQLGWVTAGSRQLTVLVAGGDSIELDTLAGPARLLLLAAALL
jgi:hypothetical protein